MVLTRHSRFGIQISSVGKTTPPVWADSGAVVGVTLGAPVITATYNSIMIELPITESTGTIVSVVADVRPTNRLAEIRRTLPFWIVRPSAGEITTFSGGSACYGAALECRSGTAYQVRLTVTDNASNVQVVNGTVTTRTDNIPAANTLTPTRYVNAGGSDAADGLTPATAWATFDKMWSTAPAGAIVQFGPGVFAPTVPYTSPNSQNGRTNSITILAQYPACADYGALSASESLRTIFAPPYRTKPSDNAWAQVTLTGPGNAGAPAGAQYTVWKYAVGQQIIHLGTSETEFGALKRVAFWKRDASHLATAAGWAEKLYTNKGYHYGAWNDANGDVYLRLPNDRNPNTTYVQMATSTFPIMLQAADCRVSGVHIRGWNYSVVFRNNPAVRGIVDHCWLDEGLYNIYLQSAIPGSPNLSSYGADHTIQHNRITDQGIRGDRRFHSDDDVIPWNIIKTQLLNADNTLYATTKIAANSETSGIGGRGAHPRTVVRYNYIEGPMNGVTFGANTSFDRYAGSGWDVHDNTIRRCADDAIEPELQAINLKVWKNRIEETLTYLSLGPVHFGPLFYWKNTVWQFGPLGVGQVVQGAQVAAAGVKFSGASAPRARVYLLHNTIWTDDPKSDGLNQFASAGTTDEDFYLRANIVRVGSYVFDSPRGAGRWDEDGNWFATTDATKGLSYRANGGSAVGYKLASDMAGYRTASGGGANTNIIGGVNQAPGSATWLDALLVDPTKGDLRLKSKITTVRASGLTDLRVAPLVGAEAGD